MTTSLPTLRAADLIVSMELPRRCRRRDSNPQKACAKADLKSAAFSDFATPACPKDTERSAIQEGRGKLLRRNCHVGVADHALHDVPVEFAVQAHADPPTEADIGQHEVLLGLRLYEALAHSRSARATARDARRRGDGPCSSRNRSCRARRSSGLLGSFAPSFREALGRSCGRGRAAKTRRSAFGETSPTS
jgi:hypothetical protein